MLFSALVDRARFWLDLLNFFDLLPVVLRMNFTFACFLWALALCFKRFFSRPYRGGWLCLSLRFRLFKSLDLLEMLETLWMCTHGFSGHVCRILHGFFPGFHEGVGGGGSVEPPFQVGVVPVPATAGAYIHDGGDA